MLPDTQPLSWRRGAGSGKSTLLRLMLRQHDPAVGWVALNGVDARLLRRDSLCAAVAAIPQQVSLVNGSIGANIAYGWCTLCPPPSNNSTPCLHLTTSHSRTGFL